MAERTATDATQLTTYLVENWSLLAAMAKRLAGSVMDADDLLSEALLSTFRRWEATDGGIEHLNAYIIGSMRNRVADELRSPRSRVGYLDSDDTVPALPHPEMKRVDLFAEIDVLREALLQLPGDQREVLEALFYREEKTGDLVATMQRSRPAVSQLARRAKINLKRTMLKVLLERGSPPVDCRHAVRELPQHVEDGPPDDETAGRHYRHCVRCRGVWAQFGTFAAAASVGAVMVCGDFFWGAAAPAAAAAATTTAAAAAADSATAGTGTAGAGIAEAPAGATRSSRWHTVATASLATVGAVALTYGFWVLPQQFSSHDNHFDVTTAADDDGTVHYQVAFDSEARGWEIVSLSIATDSSVQHVETPLGWECGIDAGTLQCLTNEQTPVEAEFVVSYNDPAPAYTLTLHARTAAGAEVVGTAVDLAESASADSEAVNNG